MPKKHKFLGNAKKPKNLKANQDQPDSTNNPRPEYPIPVRIEGSIVTTGTQESNASNAAEKSKDNSYKRHTRKFQRFSIKVAIATFCISLVFLTINAITLIFSIKAAKKSAETASKSLELNFQTTRGVLAIDDVSLQDGIKLGNETVIVIKWNNVGRSVAQSGAIIKSERWTDMPEGDMSVDEPKIDNVVEPGKPVTSYANESTPATKEEIDHLPTFTDVGLKRAGNSTTYFFGKMIYETLGKRFHTQFCYYLVKADENSRKFKMDMSNQEFFPVKCPKWNSTE